MTGRFGDESYAKEELRAEIGSLMIGDELQIGHEFGQHAAYVDHWIKVLQDDPKEILRASRDAEKIHEYILENTMELAFVRKALRCNSFINECAFVNLNEEVIER